MELALYAHPFDLAALDAHGGLARLRDLGFGEIAMATSYHDGRWLMPWHPAGRVRFLEDGTVHFRPRGDYGVLQPLVSSEVPPTGPSPLERLCEQAPQHGLRARAWNVFHHNSRLGERHPELCVQNAFGDPYTYALCPAQPAVQQYALAMVRDLAAHGGLGSIEFEALGWMGWKHSSHHDKASFTPRGLLDYALSLCFCAACRACLQRDGGDPDRSRAYAQELIRRHVDHGCAMAPAAVPERFEAKVGAADDAERVAAATALAPAQTARTNTMVAFGRAVRATLPNAVAAAVQVQPTALFTGSQLPVPQTRGLRADEYVVTAYGENLAAIDQLLQGETMGLIDGPQHCKRLSIWPKAPQFASDEDLVKVRALAEARGIATIAIYHLGLLPWRTLERVARAFTA